MEENRLILMRADAQKGTRMFVWEGSKDGEWAEFWPVASFEAMQQAAQRPEFKYINLGNEGFLCYGRVI